MGNQMGENNDNKLIYNGENENEEMSYEYKRCFERFVKDGLFLSMIYFIQVNYFNRIINLGQG